MYGRNNSAEPPGSVKEEEQEGFGSQSRDSPAALGQPMGRQLCLCSPWRYTEEKISTHRLWRFSGAGRCLMESISLLWNRILAESVALWREDPVLVLAGLVTPTLICELHTMDRTWEKFMEDCLL